MTEIFDFSDIGRLPTPGDNVAIATRLLAAGTIVNYGNQQFALSHTVMEGHRFALHPIPAGEPLLSWGLPFGHATHALQSGEYVCNTKILNTLKHRNIEFALPNAANFDDYMQRFELDETDFRPTEQVPLDAEPGVFSGFRRADRRGVGTRNFIIVLGTTSRTGSYARVLEERFKNKLADYPHVDGVVAVAHTEGGGRRQPNNRDFLLRTLAGFMVHPNVGAVLAVDYGNEVIDNAALRQFMLANNYPLTAVPHRFMSIERDFRHALDTGAEQIGHWLPEVNNQVRSEEPLSELKLALQCGGSDAFSGISGNALAGWMAKELIKHGGSANLAETDELIGAEPYVLDKVRDLATAKAFLEKIETFKERARWHGHSAEGNPSGGNQYRGLYNIALKSLGAARKKDPEVRLDHVIDYAQRMDEPGYYFMDSPGNDLESIAGQVASGANLILFITGNGSITNFPFVPTLKFVTTTGRWQMLANEMDVNAGRYQDGMPMDELGRETFELAAQVASGQLSLGERAGHAQVSVWRDWRQTEAGHVETILQQPKPNGLPLPVKPDNRMDATFKAWHTERGYVTDQIGLVVPTSLCSGQIARLLVERLNKQSATQGKLSRFVALVHTEGCGAAPGYSQQLYLRTVLGHINHPIVRKGLFLEHGCEQTHNDAMHGFLDSENVAPEQFGWTSVQLDGGIKKVMDKAAHWFDTGLTTTTELVEQTVGLEHLALGLTATGELNDALARGFALLARRLSHAGGMVIIPENAALLTSAVFRTTLLQAPDKTSPTVAYGQKPTTQGLHIMATPTDHAVETLSGLGATGVEVMLTHQCGPLLQAHPMIPLLQTSGDPDTRQHFGADLDLSFDPDIGAETIAQMLLDTILQTASRRYSPKLLTQGNTDFQLTRGLLGLSL